MRRFGRLLGSIAIQRRGKDSVHGPFVNNCQPLIQLVIHLRKAFFHARNVLPRIETPRPFSARASRSRRRRRRKARGRCRLPGRTRAASLSNIRCRICAVQG